MERTPCPPPKLVAALEADIRHRGAVAPVRAGVCVGAGDEACVSYVAGHWDETAICDRAAELLAYVARIGSVTRRQTGIAATCSATEPYVTGLSVLRRDAVVSHGSRTARDTRRDDSHEGGLEDDARNERAATSSHDCPSPANADQSRCRGAYIG